MPTSPMMMMLMKRLQSEGLDNPTEAEGQQAMDTYSAWPLSQRSAINQEQLYNQLGEEDAGLFGGGPSGAERQADVIRPGSLGVAGDPAQIRPQVAATIGPGGKTPTDTARAAFDALRRKLTMARQPGIGQEEIIK